jgi:hypothetical protein
MNIRNAPGPPENQEPLGHLVREVCDLADGIAEQITDTTVSARLNSVLAKAGFTAEAEQEPNSAAIPSFARRGAEVIHADGQRAGALAVPTVSSHGIFISYRREDAGAYARLLQSHLSGRFPDAQVFMDLDFIEVGLDFAEAIESAVCSSAVMVALIGPRWLALADEEGSRRLDNPDDYVRFEIRTALERVVRVIPVLVDGARMPRQQQLPADLQKLARLNALEMSYTRSEYDESRLARVIEKVLVPQK